MPIIKRTEGLREPEAEEMSKAGGCDTIGSGGEWGKSQYTGTPVSKGAGSTHFQQLLDFSEFLRT